MIRYFLVWKRADGKYQNHQRPCLFGQKSLTGWTSRQFAFELIEKAGVAVVPGDAFGEQGEGYVRMAIVQPSEKLAQAAERIQKFLQHNEPSK